MHIRAFASSDKYYVAGRSEEVELLLGWRQPNKIHSLPEAHSSVSFPGPDSPWIWKLWAFAGVGFMVSVGYMDPGTLESRRELCAAKSCEAGTESAGVAVRELGN